MRCIFLLLDGLDRAIQRFREAHDPQADLVQPHITLVFPFESSIPDSTLTEYTRAVASDVEPFTISLGSASVSDDYLYLPVLDGREAIHGLHDSLYAGLLEPYLMDIPYIPHITIGRATSSEMVNMCAHAGHLDLDCHIGVSTMMLERIGDSGQSIPIVQFTLGKGIA